jgi:hypothetical protein
VRYPSYAFFATKPRLVDIARALVHSLGHKFRLSFHAEGQAEATGPFEKEAALAALPTGTHDLHHFWIGKAPPLLEHSALFELWKDGTLSMDYWDLYTEFFVGNGPDEAQRAEIYSFVLTLFRALVKDAGAILSCMGAYSDKYSGTPNQDDVAGLIANALRTDRSQALKLLVEDEHYHFFWLMVLDKKALADALHTYRKKLEKHFRMAEETSDWLVLETNLTRPLFL